jgi:hypothetical protein
MKLFVGARAPSISLPSRTAFVAMEVRLWMVGVKEVVFGIARRVRRNLFMVELFVWVDGDGDGVDSLELEIEKISRWRCTVKKKAQTPISHATLPSGACTNY